MGLFSAFIGVTQDINDGISEYKKTEGAKLIDVRTPSEHHLGHIPGSENIPIENIKK